MIEKAIGASVRGKSNRSKWRLNQDAYLIDNNKMYTLAVVADGLGSKRKSRIASKLICKVIRSEVKKAFEINNLDPLKLIESIKSRWLQALLPIKTFNADTTCLFSIVSSTSILMCQLGDGMIAYLDDGLFKVLDIGMKEFSNLTFSLGNAKLKDWHIVVLKKKPASKNFIFMSTDGVADDIIETKVEDFVLNIIEKINNKKIKQNPDLKRILKNWPNKYNMDDRTMVVVK